MSKKQQDELPDIVETDFYLAWDDKEIQAIQLGLRDRSMVMEFDYEEFLDFADIVKDIKDYIVKNYRSMSSAHSANGNS